MKNDKIVKKNTKTASCSINKAASSITCANRNYTGSAQNMYSASSYCASITNGSVTNAGTYTVTCVGDANHNNSTCSATMNKVDVTLSCANKTWNGSSQTIATCSGGTLSNHTRTAAGSQTVTCTGDANHNTKTASCSINKAASSITCTNRNYTGSAQTMYTASSYCSSVTNGSVTNAGTYTVSCTPTDSYYDPSSCSTTIAKKEVTLSMQTSSYSIHFNTSNSIEYSAHVSGVAIKREPSGLNFDTHISCSVATSGCSLHYTGSGHITVSSGANYASLMGMEIICHSRPGNIEIRCSLDSGYGTNNNFDYKFNPNYVKLYAS